MKMQSRSAGNMSLAQVCPNFRDWPRRWMGLKEDLPYGEDILTVFAPFIQNLMDSGLPRRVIRKHCDNLWLLGGEIIRRVSPDGDYDTDPLKMVVDSVDSEGGLLCRHLDTPSEIRSYDVTCKRLHAFVNSKAEEGANKSPEPTVTAVTPRAIDTNSDMKQSNLQRAEARVAPAATVAHL